MSTRAWAPPLLCNSYLPIPRSARAGHDGPVASLAQSLERARRLRALATPGAGGSLPLEYVLSMAERHRAGGTIVL
jgi:hypothetical protein